MKRLLPFLLAATLLASCSSSKIETDEFLEKYLLTEMELDDGFKTPAKFNPETGTLTPLCVDPLCSHRRASEECPFSTYEQMRSYYEDGKLHYFSFTGGISEHIVSSYDIANDRAEQLLKVSEIQSLVPEGSEPSSGHVRFGYFWLDADGKPYLRVNLKNDKIEYLDPETSLGCPTHEYKGKYIFTVGTDDLPSQICIADDIDGKNLKALVSTSLIGITFDDLLADDILLWCEIAKTERGGYDWENMVLHSYDLKNDVDTVIVEQFPDVYIAAHGDYIYYSTYYNKSDETYLGINKNSGQKAYNGSGGILYRYNINTGETDKAFEMPEYILTPTDIHAVGKYVVIAYSTVDYDRFTELPGGQGGVFYDYYEAYGRIVYDTETGSTQVYPEYEEFPEGE